MTTPHLLTRRRFLQSAGVSLALPLFESMHRVFAGHAPLVPPQRMLLISNNLGILPGRFFPTDTGTGY